MNIFVVVVVGSSCFISFPEKMRRLRRITLLLFALLFHILLLLPLLPSFNSILLLLCCFCMCNAMQSLPFVILYYSFMCIFSCLRNGKCQMLKCIQDHPPLRSRKKSLMLHFISCVHFAFFFSSLIYFCGQCEQPFAFIIPRYNQHCYSSVVAYYASFSPSFTPFFC